MTNFKEQLEGNDFQEQLEKNMRAFEKSEKINEELTEEVKKRANDVIEL